MKDDDFPIKPTLKKNELRFSDFLSLESRIIIVYYKKLKIDFQNFLDFIFRHTLL